jgi:hypothetical protein
MRQGELWCGGMNYGVDGNGTLTENRGNWFINREVRQLQLESKPNPQFVLLDPRVTKVIGRLLAEDGPTMGVCGGATVRIVGGLSGSVCFGTSEAGAWGSATLSSSVLAGAGAQLDGAVMASNAATPEQMSGYGVCGGVSFAQSVIACVSTTKNLKLPSLAEGQEPTVIVFVGGSGGPSLGGGSTVGQGYSWVWRIRGSSAGVPPVTNPDGTFTSGGATPWTDASGAAAPR